MNINKKTMHHKIKKFILIPGLFGLSTPSYADSNYLSIYYVPWFLILFSLLVLIPVFFRVLYLKKKNKLTNEKQQDYWRSILVFPTFIGGVGVSLTLFPLLFALINKGDVLSLPILSPLSAFCILFIIFTRNSYLLLKKA